MAVGFSQPLRVGAGSIITAVNAQLVQWFNATQSIPLSAWGLDASGIYVTQKSNAPHFQANADLQVSIGSFSVDRPMDDSAGRTGTKLTRAIMVKCRSRLMLDQGVQDVVWLLGDGSHNPGHLALEESVIDALQEFEPTDNSQNFELTQPMKIVGGTAPVKEQSAENMWGTSTLTFSVVYLLKLNQKFQ